MERVKKQHVVRILSLVAERLQIELCLSSRNGYWAVERGEDGRVLRTGTLRECDTYVRGMFEALNIERYG